MITPSVLVYRDLRNGIMLPGSARVEEFGNAGAAIRHLEREGWKVGSDPREFVKWEGYTLHECRIIF